MLNSHRQKTIIQKKTNTQIFMFYCNNDEKQNVRDILICVKCFLID